MGMEFRPYYLGQQWLKQGHDVMVVAADYSHLRKKNPSCIGLVNDIIGGIRYLFLKTPKYKGNGIWRVLNIFAFVAWLFVLIPYFLIWKPDVVVASSTHPLDVLPAWLLARISGAKVIHEVHDLWPLTLTEIGGLSRLNPFVRLLQFAEDFSYRHVDRVVSMLQTAFPYMKEHGLSFDRFCFVPNGVLIEEWQTLTPLPLEIAVAIQKEKEQRHFIIGYAGSMGVSNSLDTLISAFSMLRDLPVSLILLGHGPERDLLQKKAQEAGGKVLFFPPIDKSQIPSFLNEVDANFIGAPRSSLYRFGVSPNKLLDYMMAGKPIIYAIDAGNNWVADAQAGITVPPEDVAGLVDGIKALASMDAQVLLEMGNRARAMVMKDFRYDYLAEKFIKDM